jgi:NTE family protein
MSAATALATGATGFFAARPVTAWLQLAGTIEATSFYDTKELKCTLERLVDFDRINAAYVRFSIGAVNVCTGNFVYFDGATHWILGRWPRFEFAPPMGGRGEPPRDTLAFQVDLWNARGEFPRTMFEVMTREREIRYSSRTRASTGQFKHLQRLRRAAAGLLEKLPDELKNSPEAQFLRPPSTTRSTVSFTSFIARRTTKAFPRITNFRASEWRNIGAPVIMMPDEHCGIVRCCRRRPITRAFSPSILLPTGASRSEA